MNSNNYFLPLSLIVISLSCFGLYKYWQKDPNSIVVGVSTDYPPFSSKENNQLIGLDIELATLIAEKLGKKIVFKEMSFPSLITSLISGRLDMIASGISPTEARSEKVDFSNVYHKDSISIVVKDASLKSLEDLWGKIVGVQTGSVAEPIAQKLSITHGILKVSFDLNTQILQALKSNRIHGLMIATTEALNIIENSKDSALHSFTISSADEATEGVALALQKNSPLTPQINSILEELEKSGKLNNLKAKFNLIDSSSDKSQRDNSNNALTTDQTEESANHSNNNEEDEEDDSNESEIEVENEQEELEEDTENDSQ